jgi:hypothetical protein
MNRLNYKECKIKYIDNINKDFTINTLILTAEKIISSSKDRIEKSKDEIEISNQLANETRKTIEIERLGN